MSAPEFQVILLIFASVNALAAWRRTMSSNRGCRQVPGDGAAGGAFGVDVGVEGRADEAMDAEIN
jgi:hypothetical protein